jgi:hypothetical protein
MKAVTTIVLLAALLVSACASAPQPVATAADCTQIDTQLAAARASQRDAQQRKDDAWKVIVPFAVVAKRAQAGSDLEAAEQRIAELQAAQVRQGCGHGH